MTYFSHFYIGTVTDGILTISPGTAITMSIYLKTGPEGVFNVGETVAIDQTRVGA